jgi:hypothetical protein
MTDEQQQQARLEVVELFNHGIIAGLCMARDQIALLAKVGPPPPHHVDVNDSAIAVMRMLDDYCAFQIEQAKNHLPKALSHERLLRGD